MFAAVLSLSLSFMASGFGIYLSATTALGFVSHAVEQRVIGGIGICFSLAKSLWPLVPRHAGIKAGYSICPIGMSFLYVHLPDNLWRVCASNFQDTRTLDCRKRCRHVELDIAIQQLVK